MKDIPEPERPYEKCLEQGPEHLTDAELLAVMLRSGSVGESALELSRRILFSSESGSPAGVGRLMHGSISEWMLLRGVGRVKAIQLVCLAELAKRMSRTSYSGRAQLSSPAHVAENYMEYMRHLRQEVVKVVFLDSKIKKLGECDISKGTVNASLISPREIYMEAVRHGAVFILVLHNHPSGDPTPSQADIDLTRRLEQVGTVLGIPLADHIVIGDRCYYSFEEHGLLSDQLSD